MVMKWISLFSIFLVIIAFILMSQNKKQNYIPTAGIEMEPPRSVYLGAWVGGFWDSKTKTLNTDILKDFENTLNKKVALANIYSEWEYLSNKNLLVYLNTISINGWVPIVSSNPSFTSSCPKKDKSLYETIASGECDDFLKSVGKNLRSYNKPLFLRFAWEMNLPDMYWSVDRVNSTPQDFINAWRRFHDILRDENANNVIWVLSFNTSSPKTIPYANLYPGDEYVDWVAIDGYNWGDAQDWSRWTSFNGVFRQSYGELLNITDKPVMLSEVNSAPTGGDKSKWLEDMLIKQIPDEYPNIKAIVFFNENKSTGENVDWRIEKSKNYVSAVQNGLKVEMYKSTYP